MHSMYQIREKGEEIEDTGGDESREKQEVPFLFRPGRRIDRLPAAYNVDSRVSIAGIISG